MNNEKILQVVEKAAKLLKENPEWTYKQSIDQAKKEGDEDE